MRIGIIGVGAMGATLARRLARLGHHLSLASPRGGDRAAAVAGELGAAAVSAAEAARASELVVLAIPTFAVAQLPLSLFDGAPGVVIDVGNYHPELRDGRIHAIDQGLPDSQWVEQRLSRPVVKAFNSIFAHSLLENGQPRDAPNRIALPVAGDSVASRALVRSLVEELGFDAVDAGELRDSWRHGTGTPAYCKDLNADELRRALAAAEPSRVGEYRAAEEARIRRAMGSP